MTGSVSTEYGFISMDMQLLKSTIDNHPTVRFIQRKLNLEGFRRYKRICGGDDDFDPLLEDKSPQQEKLESNNEGFYDYRKISCDENSYPLGVGAKQQRQEKVVQQTKLGLKLAKDSRRSSDENLNPSPEVIKPAHAKTARPKHLEFNTKVFHSSTRSWDENSDSSSEVAVKNLAHGKTVQKKQIECKPEGFLQLKCSSRTFELKENQDLSSEIRKPVHTKRFNKKTWNSRLKTSIAANVLVRKSRILLKKSPNQ
ncbi:hypothetical protein OS493_008158 [Desmophyllum pertusum]|uniref:Uncharacterized protein n=1 Tax=Desmophyllum pertusum TaxID=174260 RepID=A0A9X0A4I1_9CNID|nr:hypothetical protein OS493_008158 [Desmophyllum pertusum]